MWHKLPRIFEQVWKKVRTRAEGAKGEMIQVDVELWSECMGGGCIFRCVRGWMDGWVEDVSRMRMRMGMV